MPPPKHCSAPLAAIILKACGADPAARYSRPTDMFNDLDSLEESIKGSYASTAGVNTKSAPIITAAEQPAHVPNAYDPYDRTVSLASAEKGPADGVPSFVPPPPPPPPSTPPTPPATGHTYKPTLYPNADYNSTPPTPPPPPPPPPSEKPSMFIPDIPSSEDGRELRYCTACGTPYKVGDRFCQKCLSVLPR